MFGRFPEGSGKSDIEWEIYRAKQLPGPADYGPARAPKIGGGRFNMSKAKTDIEWQMYYAEQKPGARKIAINKT